MKVLEELVQKAERDTPNRLDENLLFCPRSVGYGRNCQVRCGEHVGNKSTSALFGLFNAVRTQEAPGFTIRQHQVLHICDPDHANLAEALVSVLASSYSDEVIGLNAKLGGGLGIFDNVGLDVQYDNNIRRLLEKGSHRAIARNAEDTERKLEALPRLLTFDRTQADRDIKAEKEVVNARYEELEKLAHEVDVALMQKAMAGLWDTFRQDALMDDFAKEPSAESEPTSEL